ncbi:MAG: hypothetical protein KJ645_02755 [Planctomycetes bacterium]|nr:hypothetical protein [Planctomycetota bacterium]
MRLALFIMAIIPFSFISAHADIINVPVDQPTIQAGIEAAVDGDTVLVAPGTYVENINFSGKTITVRSNQGPNDTVINGNQAGSVVTFSNREGPLSVVEGFTLTNGLGTYIELPISWDYCGGGVYCGGSSPTIRGNLIVQNDFAAVGGGLYCEYGSPTIINNIIAYNGFFTMQGGGIGCWFDSFPLIVNNIITGNKAACTGGGIDGFCSTPTITNNTIAMNESNYEGEELSLTCHYCMITNNIIWNESNWGLFVEGTQGIRYCNVSGGYPGEGNIDTGPLFVDPENGDFHITFNSPCRGSGDNVAPGLPEFDFEGDPRIACGTVDMGADEFHTHLYYTGHTQHLAGISRASSSVSQEHGPSVSFVDLEY